MQNIINIDYNNHNYIIYKYSTTEQLLGLKELLELPLTVWLDLLLKKNGYCRLDDLLKVLSAQINQMDSAVKSFIFKENEYWLSKNTRMNIKTLLDSSLDKFELVLDDCIVELSTDYAKLFMADLEVFAYKCFIATQKHLNSLKSFKTIEDLINYDYTKGYPDKIILNETKLGNN